MEFENKKLRDVADIAARIMMDEKALHPNQQKLDVHEPEKDELTADDFKKLRSMKKEELDLEEGMGKTLAHAVGKVVKAVAPNWVEKQQRAEDEKIKAAKRVAMDKFTSIAQKDVKKEELDLEEEQLDELTVNKMLTYRSKATEKLGSDPSKDAKRKEGIRVSGEKIKAKVTGMKKEEVEQIEEMFPGTPEYEKKYGKAPQDMKKGEKKKTTQGEMEKTGKGVVHRRKFSEMVESYTEGGVKGLFKKLNEEPTNAEFTAQLDDAKKRADGTKKQPDIAKGAVQAVQNEETHTTVDVIDLTDPDNITTSELDLAERELTAAEKEKKEEIVKSMKKGLAGFKERYGDRAKEVMYATATARAKGD